MFMVFVSFSLHSVRRRQDPLSEMKVHNPFCLLLLWVSGGSLPFLDRLSSRTRSSEWIAMARYAKRELREGLRTSGITQSIHNHLAESADLNGATWRDHNFPFSKKRWR